MQKTIHKTKDKNHARRITAMLMLHRGDTVSYVARTALLCPFIDEVIAVSSWHIFCFVALILSNFAVF